MSTAASLQAPAGALTSLLHAIDDLDWDRVRASLADTVVVDYTSLFDGEIETAAADVLVERWRGLLPGFDATQHMTGPVLVFPAPEEGTARLEAHVRAHHLLRAETAGPMWTVAGQYRAVVTRATGGRWRITELTLRTFYEDGNRGLVEIAAGRAATDPRSAAQPA